MSPLLAPMPQQVRALALDMSENMLAVGYGNVTTILTREGGPKSGVWNQIEQVQGPCHNRSGLVNALLFFPVRFGPSRLLIAYTEAGWRYVPSLSVLQTIVGYYIVVSTWSRSGLIQRASPDQNHNVCRVYVNFPCDACYYTYCLISGRATLSADKSSLAISTLDHSIVTYPLDKNGPILKMKKEHATRDRTKWSPMVLVAVTSSGLTLGGTGMGEVPIIHTGSDGGEMSLIRHGKCSSISLF